MLSQYRNLEAFFAVARAGVRIASPLDNATNRVRANPPGGRQTGQNIPSPPFLHSLVGRPRERRRAPVRLGSRHRANRLGEREVPNQGCAKARSPTAHIPARGHGRSPRHSPSKTRERLISAWLLARRTKMLRSLTAAMPGATLARRSHDCDDCRMHRFLQRYAPPSSRHVLRPWRTMQ